MITPPPPQDTRLRIISAARDLMFASSYTEVGVAAICDQAGVRKGSFYHFFPSKKDLTLAVLDAHFADAKAQMLDLAFAPDIPPLARLGRLADMAYQFQAQLQHDTGHVLGCPFGNLATEMSTQEESIRSAILAIMTRFQGLLRDTLAEAKAQHALDGVDIEATAEAMLAYFEGVMLMAKTANDAHVIQRLLPAMAAIRIPQASE